jgi:hypothetical protein
MIDFDGVGETITTRIRDTVTGFKSVHYEADERDFHFANMPMCNVEIESQDPSIRAGQDYVTETTYLVRVVTFDLSSYKAASLLRSSLLKSTQNAVRASPLLHVDLESIVLGPAVFSKAIDEKTGAWECWAAFQVRCIAYSDRS